MRQQIGQVMKTQEIEEAVCGTLGYNTNMWAIAAVCNGQVNVSEPWVSKMSQYSSFTPRDIYLKISGASGFYLDVSNCHVVTIRCGSFLAL